jgi:hypothetical protein
MEPIPHTLAKIYLVSQWGVAGAGSGGEWIGPPFPNC